MLGKLMKHEFRATSRILLPLLSAELLLSVFAGFSVRGLYSMSGANDSVFLRVLYIILLGVFFLGLFAICVVAFVLMIQRFYRSLLRDEGYLSMTLPVSVDGHILAKLLVSFVWFAAAGLLCAVSMLVVMGIARPTGIFPGLGEALRESLGTVGGGNLALFCLEGLALGFFATCAACLRCYSAMAIGCSANDHKLAFSFLTYILIGIGLSIIRNTLAFSVLPGIDANVFVEMSSASQFHGFLWLVILASAVYCAPFYFLTRWFLKNKLNLA